MPADPIQAYLNSIKGSIQSGIATEHTYRAALEKLLESVDSGIDAVNEPRRSSCGAPDFQILRTGRNPFTIGFAEAKDVDKSLEEIEKDAFRAHPATDNGGQLKRYFTLGNLLFTNYLEFRWYVDGERRALVTLAALSPAGKLRLDQLAPAALTDLLQAFLSQSPQLISKPKDLALRMARLTHFIRDIIIAAFESDMAKSGTGFQPVGGRGTGFQPVSGRGTGFQPVINSHGQDAHATTGPSQMLLDLRHAFAQSLIPDLENEDKVGDFADMFAQTLAYGLFAARCNHRGPGPFQRLGAAREIPKTNPFLRDLFDIVTGAHLDDEPFVGFVDALAQLLSHCDMAAILEDFGKRTRQQDPVIHFYETFLQAYDPKKRELRGVYYTPEPVVSYIVRSVDYLLKTRFNLPGGLADTQEVEYEREVEVNKEIKKQKGKSPRVLILDPACGTGTFLYAVVDHIREQFMRTNNAGMWSGFVKDHLLPRLFGFELLMAPYAVAHFKLGMQLAGQDLDETKRNAWAYDFSGEERLGIYLTNTLEEAERRFENLLGEFRIISDEAHAAAHVKRDLPIMVVMGNPPYSGHSANRSWELKDGKKVPTFIGKLVRDYYQVDGQPLGERNPKWLQDDYVKFIRFGQWRIEKSGAGVLAFITNNGYLDNPTFRGMRQQIINTFSDIYILNLHGSSKKKETCPDGSEDKNVFDIQQGVTIGIYVKDQNKTGPAKVHYVDVWGLRDEKYQFLLEKEIANTSWIELHPKSPDYFFIPQESGLSDEYVKGWRATDIFPINSVGIVTARDALTIQFSKDEVWQVVSDFAVLPEEQARQKYSLPEDAKDWKISLAQEDLNSSGPNEKLIKKILYRPFDGRYTYYTGHSSGFHCRPRAEVMNHLIDLSCLALVVPRRVEIAGSWQHALVTRNMIDHVAVSLKTIDSELPLYLRIQASKNNRQTPLLEASCWPPGKDGRVPNLNPKFVEQMERRLGLRFVSDGVGDLGLSDMAKSGTGILPVSNNLHEHPAHATNSDTAVSAVIKQDAHATFFNLSYDDSLKIRQGAYLPHWTREGATYAVIFRLADSLPQEVLQEWLEERERLIKRIEKKSLPLSEADEKKLQQLFSEKVEKYLDAGIGECWLRRDDVAQLVADALQEFNGERYDLIAWSIMPNHVHVIVRPFAGSGTGFPPVNGSGTGILPVSNNLHEQDAHATLPEILHSWKSFSAKESNKLLGRTGTFWQTESYDHLIRDEADYYHCVEYTLQNPEKAGLQNWKWRGFGKAVSGTGVPPVIDSDTGILPVSNNLHGQDAHATINGTFGPEDIFHYIYAVFHSPTYRSRYAEFLKIDFPRVPLTSDLSLFRTLCHKGAQLVALHLLESPALQNLITQYPAPGDNLVEKGFPKYLAPGELAPITGEPLTTGRVYISADRPGGKQGPKGDCPSGEAALLLERRGSEEGNPKRFPSPKKAVGLSPRGQYFAGVPKEVWEFQVGGYQVCEKWLKDRRGRNLSHADLIHYQQIVLTLKETIRLMGEIDAAIPGWPIE